jgi:hypothetical protein
MKILFLDNDGVICLSNNWGGRSKKWAKYRSENPGSSTIVKENTVLVRFDDFDQKAIKVLNEILEETGAEIVVSSDWKLHANLEELGEYYESQGIIKKPIAVTPNLEDFDPDSAGMYQWKGWLERKRILEIEEYMRLNPEITHWAAIDDLDMSRERNQGHGLKNFVLTPRSNEGIKQSGVKEKVLSYFVNN